MRLVTGLGAGSYNDNISVTSDDPSSPASIAVTGEVLSETLPYFESFGTTAGVFPLGWTTSGPGATNWVVNGTSASPSGGNNIGDAGANITNQEAIITVNRAISTVGADEVFISFLARRTAAYSGSMLFDYSINGTDWFNVPFADVANDGNWGSVGFSLPSAAAGVANLRLRFRTTRTNSSGNYRIDDFRVLAPARFVYQSGPLHQTTSWEDADTDNPADFTSDNQLFVIEGSTTVSTTDAWTVSGSNSRIILGDATNSATLTITDDNAITGTIQVRNNAVLNLNNTTLPTLSGLEDASTVVYGMNAAATIQSVAYGNLTVTGSGIKTFPNSTIAVNGNLTWTDVTLGFGGSNARIDYAGNITLSGTVDYDGGIRPEFRVTANSAAQSITTNGQTLEAFNFYAQNKTGGSLNITSGSAIQALNNMRLNFPAGVSFNDGGNTLVFGDDFRIEGDVASYTLNGTFKLLASSGTNDFENIQVALNNLEIETTGTSDPQFADGSNTNDITINGNLVLNIAGNNLVMNGVTLRVGGNITDNSAADKIDAGTSTLVLNGTAAQAISINSAMNNLTIDKSAGTATINSDLALNNLLTLTVGVLDANGHLILKSTSATQTAQVIGGNNSNLIGDVIAERFLPWSSANNNGFRFVSHPLRANPVFNTVSNLPTANNTLIGYDEAGNAYVGINNRGNSWPQGVGYGVWANAVNTLEFIGALQLSDLNNISMSNTNNRWNYAGNPFPSVLDWEEVTLNDMQDAVWVWVKDDVAEGGGVWAAYVDGVSTDGGSQYIAPMQGFMVRALASGSPSISFPATARVSGQSPAYQRVSTTADLLRVNLRKAANGSEMQTIIRFRPQASNSFDASFDAEFVSDFMNATPDLYTTDAQGVKYSINSLEPLGAQPVLVPLQVETFGAGEFSFAFNSSAMISGASIQLEDTKLGSFSTINDGDVVSFTAAATDAVDRFRLHFNGMATSVHDSQLDQLNMYAHEGILYIRGIEQAEQLRIMDMTGRKVFEAHQLQIQAEGVRPNLSKGTYLVQLVSPSGVKTVKVIF
ncbi:MAG: T9SS type A sorting domain-containing protein [Bacteroidia bacterium]